MEILNIITNFIDAASSFLWGWPLIILLFGTHLYLTFRTGFIQKHLFKAIKISFQKDEGAEGDVSQFGALATALAATIGTGNIVGVATAIVAGGPGAVLWMWLTGIFGIATKYSEALLSVKYRVHTESGFAGGPMYVLERGLNMKWLGVIFAALTAVAAFGIGNMVQANSIAHLSQDTLGLNPHIAGAIMALLTALVILGGIKSIARVCEALVPFMAIIYIIGAVTLLILNFSTLGDSIALIFESAFSGSAALGGFAGAAMKEVVKAGVSRGLFSNESGLGSAPIVAAAARTKNPVRQALVSSTGTFWDTVVVCALTGLVIVNSGYWTEEGLNGAKLTSEAFGHIGVIGPVFLTFSLLTFVFSTILGWSYYGEKAAEYLFGIKALIPYRILWVIFVYVGSVQTLDLVWDFADLANGLMAIPNVLSLILLSKVLKSETEKYINDLE
ncbi:MAG: sodium:alanine symporter family protein [Ignavibacteriaceae bacterium]|nr:MAG: sodium:alanine symporter family protein [Chlorobiota bacterium]GJQ32396.1 MAG: sodium:alanine symporter family protein [Ignavibacteriaceae bacterium]